MQTAEAREERPWLVVVKCLASGDLDVKINALTLLNVLMAKSPTKKKLKALLKKWDDLGLYATLDVCDWQR